MTSNPGWLRKSAQACPRNISWSSTTKILSDLSSFISLPQEVNRRSLAESTIWFFQEWRRDERGVGGRGSGRCFELATIMDRRQRIVAARNSFVRYSTYCRGPTARNINHTAKLRNGKWPSFPDRRWPVAR